MSKRLDGIHTFSVLHLQLKKLRCHYQSAKDLSNANPARGHSEARRSAGYIMVTARYSNQQGSKSRQNPACQVQPTENIGNLSADTKSFLALGGLHKDKLCDILQATAPTNVETVHQNSLIPYREQPRSSRIVVAYPRPAFSATKWTNHAIIQSVFINKTKFLKTTRHTENIHLH